MKRKRFEKLLMGIGFSRNEVKALTRIMIARFHQPRKGITMTKYECGLTEGKVEMGDTCPLDNPNETIIKDCKDCPHVWEVERDDP